MGARLVLTIEPQGRRRSRKPLSLLAQCPSKPNSARRMYVGHLRLFLGIGLLFFPLGALITGVQYLLFRVSSLNGLLDSAGSTNAVVDFLAIQLGVVLTIFAFAVVSCATAIAMVELDAGRDASALDAYRKALSHLGPLLGAVFVAAVVIGIFGLTGLGLLVSVFLLVRWSLLAQAVALEGASAFGALHRSSRLVRGHWWRAASLILFVTVVALLLGPLCGTLLLFVSHASFDFINLVSSVVYAVVLPYAAIAATYLYFDLHVAKQQEGETAEAGDVRAVETPAANQPA